MDADLAALERYAEDHTHAEPALLQELIRTTHASMQMPQMLTGRVEGRLLKLLVALCGARRAIEIGTFTGYSALSIAEGLAEGGRLVTCDVDPDAARVAQAAFDRSPFGSRIELRLGPALDTLRASDEPLDFAFIDADKEGYPAYYDAVMARLRPGGLIVLDNALLGGEVLDPRSPAARAVAGLNARIRGDDRVENAFLVIRDGVQVVRRKSGD